VITSFRGASTAVRTGHQRNELRLTGAGFGRILSRPLRQRPAAGSACRDRFERSSRGPFVRSPQRRYEDAR
jgi:hypothetical protein